MGDLAAHFPDTAQGRMASRFLKFDLYMFKATRLMMASQLDEAEKAVRDALTGQLTEEQVEQAQHALDAISNARLSRQMADSARALNACRSLRLLLSQHYVEHGRYPPNLSLSSLDFADPPVRDQIEAALSAIEDYKVSDAGFSFVAVGKGGTPRIRVTQDEISEQKAP